MNLKSKIRNLFTGDDRLMDIWISDDESEISIHYDTLDESNPTLEIDWKNKSGFKLLSILYDLEDGGDYDNGILRIDGLKRIE